MDLPAPVPLGPDSVLGRLANDPRLAFTGFSLGVLQLMHPAVSAGVIQHSEFFSDPFDRIYRSTPRIIASILAPDGEDRAVRIRDYHRDLKGVDEHGNRYHALDPDVFWWTHATFVWGFLTAADRFHHRPPKGARRAQFYAESVEWWRRYGLSMRPVAPDLESFLAEFDRVCAEELEWTVAAERALNVKRLEFPLMPAPISRAMSVPGTPFARFALYGGLPEVVRQRFDIPWSRREERAYWAMARSVRNAGRLFPDTLAQQANATFLKRLGATTQLSSAS